MAASSVAFSAVADPDDNSASRPQPPAIRRLPWPQLAPVNLLQQCPWLVLHKNPLDEWNERAIEQASKSSSPQQVKSASGDRDDPTDNKTECPPHKLHRSPLKQRQRAKHEPPVSQSPAQQAARKMLKLQEKMEREETRKARTEAGELASDLKNSSATALNANSQWISNRQPQVTKVAKKKTMKVPVNDSPQYRLHQWLSKQRSPPDDDIESARSSDYSIEMETRIQCKMNDTLGDGLWKDGVASLIAAELTSESVFGGFVSTRRLAFDQGATTTKMPLVPRDSACGKIVALPSPSAADLVEAPISETSPKSAPASPLRVSAVETFSDEVREQARELVAEGHVHDALQSLQDGIERVLYDFQDNQDEITAHGFDFSALAHAKATRLQLTYKARHRRRLRSLVKLQRMWRRFQAHNKWKKERKYQVTNAQIIQSYYKKRFYHRKRESCATRIQRCFRIFQQQKTLIRLHQACRMLNSQERRKRERIQQRKALRRRLWSKLKVILRLIRLFRIRRFSICWLQSRWRGWKARQSYARVLTEVGDAELVRRAAEDAFVEQRLARVMTIVESFYRETAAGRNQVKWKTRQPWLRWRRLRSQWHQVDASERAAVLCGIYGPNTVVRGLERAAVGALLTGTSWDNGQEAVAISPGGLKQWLNTRPHSVATRSHATPEKAVGRQLILKQMASAMSAVNTTWVKNVTKARHYATAVRNQLLWRAVFYPKLVLRNMQMKQKRREDATEELLADQRRVWRSLLRHVFRVVKNAPPKFACSWCGEGCATARAYYTHCNTSGGCRDQQAGARLNETKTRVDVELHTNRFKALKNGFKSKGRQRWRPRATPGAARPVEVTSPAMSGSVRGCRVAKVRGNRAGLQRLLEAAECCEPEDSAAEASAPPRLVPEEMLILLLSSLDDNADNHPLVRLQLMAVKDASWSGTGKPPVGWIPTEEVRRELGLSPVSTNGFERIRRGLRSLQDAVNARWRLSRGVGGRYRSPVSPGAGPARVLAAA